ncbi:hypothetical protein [Neobacillus sp. 114]|uniref:hypothetical protein n=1 Tax=Neobacillus sp. 114 TaxID=3048535 RepID=UPI0024C37ACD|nr:hypothetical protein [Neobacillus sp. 114]
MKQNNKTNSTKATKQQTATQQKQTQLQENGTSLWVRNFVAIANCLQNLGKGLCWIFGSFVILAFVVFILMGDIGAKDLMDATKMYFGQ